VRQPRSPYSPIRTASHPLHQSCIPAAPHEQARGRGHRRSPLDRTAGRPAPTPPKSFSPDESILNVRRLRQRYGGSSGENMTNEENPVTKARSPYEFIPRLKGKKVIIRLISGGQPVTGTVEGYNPQEILLQTAKGQLLVFKHAMATIEIVDEPHGYRPSV